jgi:hypothetical protein
LPGAGTLAGKIGIAADDEPLARPCLTRIGLAGTPARIERLLAPSSNPRHFFDFGTIGHTLPVNARNMGWTPL